MILKQITKLKSPNKDNKAKKSTKNKQYFLKQLITNMNNFYGNGYLLHENQFCMRGHFCTETLLHEGSLSHSRSLLHGITFIRRVIFAQRVSFCTIVKQMC